MPGTLRDERLIGFAAEDTFDNLVMCRIQDSHYVGNAEGINVKTMPSKQCRPMGRSCRDLRGFDSVSLHSRESPVLRPEQRSSSLPSPQRDRVHLQNGTATASSAGSTCQCGRPFYVGKGLLNLRKKMKNLGEAISLDDIISDPRININITRCRSTMRGTPSVAPAGAKLYDNLPSSPAVTFLSRISDPGSAEPSAVSSLRIGDRIGDYLVGQKIAETGFSTVYAANHVCTASDGDDCAPESYSFVVKAISQDASPMGVPMSKIIRNELYMWSTLCHENIVRMVDYMISKNDVFIVSEFMEGGNMLDFLNRSPCRLVEPEAKRIFRMITSGLHYLHSVARVFHGDLKLENILLSRDGYIKISDFGLTSAVSLDPRGSSDSHFSYPAAVDSFFGSIVYCPPEVICGLRVVGGIEFDIWSLGCILYALATGVLPFKDMLLPRLKDSIANAAYDKSLLSESGASKELVAQIDLILQVDPQKRPNTHQIIAGPWLRLSRPSQPRGSPGRSKRDTPRNCDYK